MRLFFSVFLFLFGMIQLDAQANFSNTELREWEFQEVGSAQWNPAIVPGSVQLNLLESGKIEDPFYRDNENHVQWISDKDWAFRTQFTVDQHTLDQENVQLVFEGLDTYASIKLNGQEIAITDNYFRIWRIPVQQFLKLGTNELIITFEAPAKRSAQDFKAIGYKLPGGERVVSRKPQYHFGWDWGLKLILSGIHRPVRLESWSGSKIEDLYIQQDLIQKDRAECIAQISISSPLKQNQSLVLRANGEVILEKEISLKKGENKIHLPFIIQNPKLWWCAGMGEQHLYNFEIHLGESQKKTVRTGLRKIELVTEKDAIGESFYFRLNGKAIFAKGANYIPVDILQGRVKKADYERVLDNAIAANMNMLRVWGGGQYETDQFYELCDEKGILIWQDFMFACAMYPGDQAFMENVRQEALDNITRLRNHPSIALWCGNNENSEGWNRWGWKLQVPPFKVRKIGKDYKKLFNRMLPKLVAQNHPEINYWESSPRYGRGNPKHQFEGDSHYWGVWHDAEPFEMYLQKVPRFMSEFGFQSFPNWQTVESFTAPEDRSLESDVMNVHQKHPRGNKLIRKYMDRKYPVPENFEDFVYVSQLVQAEGMQLGIEAHRLSQPRCMGTLYWQLNDIWPVASWSSVDYYGRWKAMHYAVRDAFAPVQIVDKHSKELLRLFILYEGQQTLKATMHYNIYSLENGSQAMKQVPVELKANTNQIGAMVKIDLEEFQKYGALDQLFSQVHLIHQGDTLASRSIWFAEAKKWSLPDPELSYTISESEEYIIIEISAKAIAKSVYLEWSGRDNFSNNFFDLLPGNKPYRVTLPKSAGIESVRESFKLRSYFDVQD